MKIAIITINKDGENLAKRLMIDFPDARVFTCGKNLAKTLFNQYEGLIFIAPLGVTVRLIAGLIKSKFKDPAVVSIDTAGRFSISVLSGHEGGANRLAFKAAASLEALAVITTGKEVHKKFVLGLGTRKGIDADSVKQAINKAIKKKGIKLEEIRLTATIEIKKNEKGLLKACDDLDLPLIFISKESIRNFKPSASLGSAERRAPRGESGLSCSDVVRRHIGLDGVCEPCALLAGRRATLILRKNVSKGVAVAIAEES